MKFSRLSIPATLPVMVMFLFLGHAVSAQSFFGQYGDEITADNAVAVADLDEGAEVPDDVIKLEGEIDTTCKMKGCWMTVKDGDGGTMRVTFKDYGFFVPKEGVAGKTAVMQGKLERKTTSVEELQHYAKDAGKSDEEIAAITEPKVELSFVADGVIIR